MHTFTPLLRSVLRSSSLLIAGAALGLSALGATTGVASETQARYEQDRAKCLTGRSNQDQATCLKEAGAARDAAKKGQLNDADAKYGPNAKQRCDALTGDEAKDCLARMQGSGTVSGSVEAGGLYRQTVTTTIMPANPPASSPPSPAAPASSTSAR